MKGEYLKEKRHKYTKYMCYRMDNSKYVAKVSPHHAHDKSIRMFLKDKAEAVNFINKVLYNKSKEPIKENEIEEHTEDFITIDYKDKEADIVYKDNREEGSYFLIEHQTKIDPYMPFRIAEYALEIIRMEYRKGIMAEVTAIVLYTGKENWKVPLRLGKKLRNDNQIGTYSLYELNKHEDTELIKDGKALSIGLVLERAINSKNLVEKLNEILGMQLNLSKESRNLINIYIMNVLKGILGEEETKEIIKRLNKEKEEENNMFMLEETLRNEMMENRNIGRKEGWKEGIKETKIQIARRMSKLGFDVKEISEIMKISEKDVNKMLDSNKLEIDENAEK